MLGNRLSLRGLGAPLETERGNKTAVHKTQHGRGGASATRFSLVVALNVGRTVVFMFFFVFFKLKSVSSAGGTSHAVEKNTF